MNIRRARYNETWTLFQNNDKFVKKPAICSPYYNTVGIIVLINATEMVPYVL